MTKQTSLNQTARRTVVSQTFASNNRQRFVARMLMLGASDELLCRHGIIHVGGGHFSQVYTDQKDPSIAYKVSHCHDSLYEARVVDREKETWWQDDNLVRKGDQWLKLYYSREGMDGYAMWAHICLEARKMGCLPAWAPVIHAAYHKDRVRSVYVLEALESGTKFPYGPDLAVEREKIRNLVKLNCKGRNAVEGAFVGIIGALAADFWKISDMHGDNIMQRGEQPVMTDPWAECQAYGAKHHILNPSKKKVTA